MLGKPLPCLRSRGNLSRRRGAAFCEGSCWGLGQLRSTEVAQEISLSPSWEGKQHLEFCLQACGRGDILILIIWGLHNAELHH